MFHNILNYIKYLFQKPACQHDNICKSSDISYCPDCGELIEINWYLIKCSCCSKKRTGIMRNGIIHPLSNFCSNCGTNSYTIEKIKNINYFDMNFAVLRKESVSKGVYRETTQVWIDYEQPERNNVPVLRIAPIRR